MKIIDTYIYQIINRKQNLLIQIIRIDIIEKKTPISHHD